MSTDPSRYISVFQITTDWVLSSTKEQKNFNLYSQLGVGHRTFPEPFEMANRIQTNNNGVIGTGNAKKNETFFSIILGADYHINDQNVLSLTGNFAYELETEYSTNNFNQLGASGVALSRWSRDEATEAVNPKWQYEMQFKREFSENKEQGFNR